MYAHEAAEELFGIIRTPGIGIADERTIDSCPSSPFHLKECKSND